MSDLILAEESRQFQELTRNFAQKEIARQAHDLDQSGVFPKEIFAEAKGMGLMNVLLPEEAGGLGLSLSDACVIVEEIAVACAATAMTFVASMMALAPLLLLSDKGGKSKFAERMSPEVVAGIALGAAEFTKSGASEYSVSAKELVILNGENAEWVLVEATAADKKSASLFILNRQEIQFLQQVPRLGLKCADLARVDIAAKVSAERMVGDEGSADKMRARIQCVSAPLMAACATGIIRAALEHSLRYSKERQAFGQPIANFQSIAFMMADMARAHQAARLLTWRAARLHDSGTTDRTSALSALGFAADAAMTAATDAVQIFGGYGYSKEYPVEKLMRDAKVLQMLQPTSFECRVELGRELVTAR